MKIAYIGWGSLVWDPRDLPVRRKWFSDGPLLPIEFARKSKDDRITLVIAPGSAPVRTLWAIASVPNVEHAAIALAKREGIPELSRARSIGIWQQGDSPENQTSRQIGEWATQNSLDAAVWTVLPVTLNSVDEVISHLSSLSHEKRQNAEIYVRRAPTQIDTDYRRRLTVEFGWITIDE